MREQSHGNTQARTLPYMKSRHNNSYGVALPCAKCDAHVYQSRPKIKPSLSAKCSIHALPMRGPNARAQIFKDAKRHFKTFPWLKSYESIPCLLLRINGAASAQEVRAARSHSWRFSQGQQLNMRCKEIRMGER